MDARAELTSVIPSQNAKEQTLCQIRFIIDLHHLPSFWRDCTEDNVASKNEMYLSRVSESRPSSITKYVQNCGFPKLEEFYFSRLVGQFACYRI